MVKSTRDVVTTVVASLEAARETDFEELQIEFETSTRAINGLIESWKRKIIDTGGLSNFKKMKTNQSTGAVIDKENNNPNFQMNINVNTNDAVKKPGRISPSSFSSSSAKNNQTESISEKQENQAQEKVEEPKTAHVEKQNLPKLDVNSMKVAELRKHLRSRGLEQQGLKRTLQLRLQRAIDEENVNEETETDAVLEESTNEDQPQCESDVTGTEQTQGKDEVSADLPMDIIDEKRASIGSAGLEADNVRVEEPNNGAEVGVEDDVSMECSYVAADMNVAELEKMEIDDTQQQLVEVSVAAPQPSSTKPPKKKAFGKKLMKATTKLFSPNKNKSKDKSSKKEQFQGNGSKRTNIDTRMEAESTTSSSSSSSDRHGAALNKKTSANLKNNNTTEANDSSLSPYKRASMVCDMSITEINEEMVQNNSDNAGRNQSSSKHSNDTHHSQASNSTSTAPIRVPLTATKLQPGSTSTATSATYVASTPSLPVKVAGVGPISSSKAQAKKRAIDEARKARLDKIRNKVAQSQASSAIKPNGVGGIPYSAMKSAQKPSTTAPNSAEERKRAIAAQMRSKVIATSSASVPASSIKAHEKPYPASEIKAAAPAAAPIMTTPMHSHDVKFKNTNTSSHKQQQQQQQQKQQAKKVLSPMDTYEMSDREGDSDEESDASDYYEEKGPKKKVPKWAQKDRLLPALERQFLDNPDRVDPDTIFHEVSTCDLEAIFGQRKKRYAKRASTGNWTKDRVTASEKLVYKRKMGFQKR
mmetsp:Transcript_6804/g.10019  ORF Transcript_6804/g.10019 Transcript_6804/m.10019 type:complete len:758 (+) Transcript_6804:314-2587(+)